MDLQLEDYAKRALAAEEKAKFLEKIIADLPGIIFWKDANGLYKGGNNNFLKLASAASINDVIGKSDYEIFPTEAEQFIAHDKQVYLTQTSIQVEEEKILDNGQTQPYFAYKAPLFNDEHKLIGLVGVAIDFTQYKRREETLVFEKEKAEAAEQAKLKFISELVEQVTGQKASSNNTFEQHILEIRNYLENIIAWMPGLIFWKDEKGTYLGCNNNLADTFKFKTRYEIIGKTDYEIFDHETARVLRENDAEVMASGKSIILEESTSATGKERHIFLTSKVPLYNEAKNKAIGILGISVTAHPITPKKVKNISKKA